MNTCREAAGPCSLLYTQTIPFFMLVVNYDNGRLLVKHLLSAFHVPCAVLSDLYVITHSHFMVQTSPEL